MEVAEQNVEIPVRFAAPKQGRIWLIALAVFSVSFLLFFLGMDRNCNPYDEGIVLTGAMKVANGHIPYRDFYANYGPAEFYILGWLFKLFGPSVLVERLFDLLVKAGIVTACFGWCAVYCRKSVSLVTSLICLLWLFSFDLYGPPVMPAVLLSLLGSGLFLSAYVYKQSDWRMAGAGAVTGLTALFRCDIGFGLFLAHLCFISIRVVFSGRAQRSFADGVLTAWKYIVGVAMVFVPSAAIYLAVAPAHDFIFDMITYPSKYYARARNLPFPGVHMRSLDSLGVYLPILVIGILLCLLLASRYRRKPEKASSIRFTSGWDVDQFFILFGLLILVFYGKGLVRVSTFHMFLAIAPSLIVIAVLSEHARERSLIFRWVVAFASLFAVTTSAWAALRTANHSHSSVVLSELISPPGPVSLQSLTSWCDELNPLHRGLCFLVDADHIKAIRFIESHTGSNDYLFVGLPHHDRILVNDVLIYFAVGREPATRWYHFDPDLQTTADIQREMINEIKSKSVPYILLDSEFDNHDEPNDSSKSSGVTLLDDFIRANYRQIELFGELSVWQVKKASA